MPLDLLAVTVRHFFPELNRWFDEVPDHRDPERITYRVRHLLWEELLMFLSGAGSRYAMVGDTEHAQFRDALLDLSKSAGKAVAHPDTAYAFLRKLHPSHLAALQARLVRRLLRMRALDSFRFGLEWLVAVDATWLRTYDRQHCPRCLHQKQPDGTVRWMHAVLEAKLILSNRMAISLASVSIENRGPVTDRQDCELKALPRLARLLKKLFPRLPICLTMDSLYANAPVMKLCEEMNWSYIAVFTPGRTPALWKRAVAKAQQEPAHTRTREDGTVQVLRWAVNLTHEGHTTHALFCDETDPDGTVHHWAWLSDHRPDQTQAPIIANQGGHPRWRIENEGFNAQKNGEFGLKHDYGSKGNTWYNDYLIVQIAHLLQQLIQFGDLIRKLSAGAYATFIEAFHTIRGFFTMLRASLQRDRVSPAFQGDSPLGIQIRLNSS